MMEKRDVYRGLCALLGALLGLLFHALLELFVLGRGWHWPLDEATYDALRIALVIGGAATTWHASAHWWQILYVEKRYGTPRF